MSLTSAMKDLRMEITNGKEKRKTYIASLKCNTSDVLLNFKSKRLNDENESKNLRIRQFAELKNNVKCLMSDYLNARKSMGADMRQSLDGFMSNLRSSTANVLDSFKKERNIVIRDIVGAKGEWNSNKKKRLVM